MLCGKLRSCVLNFEVNDTDHEEGGASGWSSTFRVRKSYKDHSLAFGRLLVYLDHFKCPILPKYKILVSGEGYSQDRCVEQGLIAKLLFELTMKKFQMEIHFQSYAALHYLTVFISNMANLRSRLSTACQNASHLFYI